jgi:hypothetical protein
VRPGVSGIIGERCRTEGAAPTPGTTQAFHDGAAVSPFHEAQLVSFTNEIQNIANGANDYGTWKDCASGSK